MADSEAKTGLWSERRKEPNTKKKKKIRRSQKSYYRRDKGGLSTMKGDTCTSFLGREQRKRSNKTEKRFLQSSPAHICVEGEARPQDTSSDLGEGWRRRCHGFRAEPTRGLCRQKKVWPFQSLKKKRKTKSRTKRSGRTEKKRDQSKKLKKMAE